MRQLEADWAREHTSIKGLQRPKAAYESATMLVDASQHAWKVIYINSPASKITGNLAGLLPDILFIDSLILIFMDSALP